MSKRRNNLINNIQLIFFISMFIFLGIFLFIQITSYRDKSKKQSEYIKINYINEQKAIVKREVERVVNLIDSRILGTDKHVEEIVRDKVYMAYDVAQNIYRENRNLKTEAEISKMIKDALRHIRFEGGRGYFFITGYEGKGILNADNPNLEGQNLVNLVDNNGQFIIQDMIDISKIKGEGIYEYLWTKPEEKGKDHRKISFIKHFEPFDWIIGTGLYLNDVEDRIKENLLREISNIRFGQEGYIFVNTLDSYALVANGNFMAGDQKLWEVFDRNPSKTKELFQKEYEAARKNDGDFIYYSIQKMNDSAVESPKTSFIFGMPQLNWLIGAGVYLDDIDREIAELQNISIEELKAEIQNTIVIAALFIFIFMIIFFIIGKKLQQDFYLFTEFFDKAVLHDVKIDLNEVRYNEMVSMADQANKMQHEKISAQEKLKESESLFRLISENSKDMIFQMTMPGGIYEYISPASIDILGYTPREIMDEPYHVRKSIHPDWTEWLEEKLQNIMDGFSEDSFEYLVINKSGKEVWINQKSNFIRNERGEITTIIGRLSDETKRKKAEEKLSQSYRMDAIGQLAGGVAHDFNNVLAGIINAAQVLKSPKREIDEKGKKMVDLIMTAALRAADLTAKLSTFSRKKTLLLKPQDVHHIIEETAVILKRTIDKKIHLNIENKAEKNIVTGDGSELQSAILNLVINASHAMPDGGSIDIITDNRFLSTKYCETVPFDVKEGNFLEVVVRDTGSGIKPENLKRIFEPFFSTKETGKGTGLGLATVYSAVVDHKGLIEVESAIGKGTSFTLVFPCTEDVPEEKIKVEKLLQGTGRILLVDDEDIIRSAGRNMLEDMGFTVLVAENGLKAVELYKAMSHEIDIVIMDVVMPEMSGIEAFGIMREINPDCSIIMISGHSGREDVENLKKSGLKAFLKKPFTDEGLMKIIDEILKD